MTKPDSDAGRSSSTSRGRAWKILKWSMVALVLAFVAKRGQELWNQDAIAKLDVDFGWLVLAGCAYLVGWLPSVWFWNRLLHVVGGDVSFVDSARAYYCGHLGKYIPGKATVLVIRAGMVKDRGSRAASAALTATYETLGMMGVGVAVAVALSPLILSDSQWLMLPEWLRRLRNMQAVIPLIVAVVAIASLPLVSRLFTFVAVKLAPSHGVDSEARDELKIPTGLLLKGVFAFVLAWACHGLSLGLTVRSIVPQTDVIAGWPVWMGAASLATAVGFFFIFAPGGIGVREGLLWESLRIQPEISDQQAVVAACLLRLVWFAAEIVAATALYYWFKSNVPNAGSSPNDAVNNANQEPNA